MHIVICIMCIHLLNKVKKYGKYELIGKQPDQTNIVSLTILSQ